MRPGVVAGPPAHSPRFEPQCWGKNTKRRNTEQAEHQSCGSYPLEQSCPGADLALSLPGQFLDCARKGSILQGYCMGDRDSVWLERGIAETACLGSDHHS